MSYRLEQHENIPDGIRRIAAEQIDKSIGELAAHEIDRHETAHQVRKRCKKMRSLAHLLRTRIYYEKANRNGSQFWSKRHGDGGAHFF